MVKSLTQAQPLDVGGKTTAPAYTVVVDRKFGRIWTLKPQVQTDGLLTILRGNYSQERPGPIVKPQFTAVAFNLKAETLAAADSRGSIFLFHIIRQAFLKVLLLFRLL
jgi:hypothetical protein